MNKLRYHQFLWPKLLFKCGIKLTLLREIEAEGVVSFDGDIPLNDYFSIVIYLHFLYFAGFSI
jgi:hypothetical protein